jgi:hypothetical protein
MPEWYTLSIGLGGWVRYEDSDLGVPVFVRFTGGDTGRLAAVDLFIPAGSDTAVNLDARLLRKVPFGRIEALVNGQVARMWVMQKSHRPGPDLRRLVSHFDADFGPGFNRPWDSDWVARSIAAQYSNLGEPQVEMRRLSEGLTDDAQVPPALAEARLSVPERRPYGNDFYRDVAVVYREIAGRVRSPAGLIADANHVHVSQVHRWVKIARAKEFLPPGRVGKAG